MTHTGCFARLLEKSVEELLQAFDEVFCFRTGFIGPERLNFGGYARSVLDEINTTKLLFQVFQKIQLTIDQRNLTAAPAFGGCIERKGGKIIEIVVVFTEEDQSLFEYFFAAITETMEKEFHAILIIVMVGDIVLAPYDNWIRFIRRL